MRFRATRDQAANLLTQIRSVIPEIRPSGDNGWYSFPACLACGKTRHHYFNPKLGHRCHRCLAHGNVLSLVDLLRKAGYSVEYDGGIALGTMEEFWAPIDSDEDQSASPNISLPDEAQPVTKERYPAYFVDERGYDLRLLLDLQFHYCVSGYYAMRIIIPLYTLEHAAFLAYTARREHDGKKVLYPKGCSASQFLFPFNQLGSIETNRLVLFEGSTDVLRVLQHRARGSHSDVPLALLGKNLSQFQLNAIARRVKADTEIVLALDLDVEDDKAYQDTSAVTALKLAERFGRDRVSLLRLSSMPRSVADRVLEEKLARTPEDERASVTFSSLDPDDVRLGADWNIIMSKREPLTHCLF